MRSEEASGAERARLERPGAMVQAMAELRGSA